MMKKSGWKRAAMLLAGIMAAAGLAACGSTAAGVLDKGRNQPLAGTGKTLIVYYSATGHTENVAGYIAAATDADIFVLEPAEPYSSDDLDWTDENSRVSREHENEAERNVELVAATVEGWESYDTVFVGYPKMEYGFNCVLCA